MWIDFESEDFPIAGPVMNGSNTLSASWSDLLWAAITVGRPNRYYALRHGASSLYELIFRASALRLAIEQRSSSGNRLWRTPAAKNLDPSEKAALNYFLGLTMSKLFADKLLHAPWLLHLDVFRSFLNPRFLSGRSRPDLVGLTGTNQWIAMESKGRVTKPSPADRDGAKIQAERIVEVRGSPVALNIAAFAYFRNEALSFHWRDPKPEGEEPPNAVRLPIKDEDFWRGYYERMLETIGSDDARLVTTSEVHSMQIEEADLTLRVATPVMKRLIERQWSEAGNWCLPNQGELARYELHSDGVAVVAGDSWSQRHHDMAE